MTKAIRRLMNFNFAAEDAHIALVDVAANGTEILLRKNFTDHSKWDQDAGEFVPLEESGLKVNMSIEDMLMFFTNLFPEDIETLTAAITKAADGPGLRDIMKVHVVDNPGVVDLDVFKARLEKFEDQFKALDADGIAALRSASFLINKFLAGDIPKPIQDLMEKSEMTPEEQAAADAAAELAKGASDADSSTPAAGEPAAPEAPVESVSKAAFDAQADTISEQATQIAELTKAEDTRVTATFITKAKGYEPLGLPEVEEGKDAAVSFGLALKALSKANPEAYAQVESVLTKALDTISKGENLEEIGVNGQPDVTDNATAIAKAAAKQKEADPTLTDEQAVSKALEADPDLYTG